MTHLRRGFRSRAPAPSDSYRRMFATLAAPTRAIPSRDTPASRASYDVPAYLTHHHQLLTPEAKTFSYNGLINLTKVIKKMSVLHQYCTNVTYNKSANNVWRISGKRNKSPWSIENAIRPQHSSINVSITLRQKNQHGPESLLSFFFDHRSLLSYLKASRFVLRLFLVSFSRRRRFNSGPQQWAS